MVMHVIDGLTLESFTTDNIAGLHEFFEKHASEGLYSFPLVTFKAITLEDMDFDASLSIVARDPASHEIMAAFMAINRVARINIKGKEIALVSPVVVLFAVHSSHRRKGIGSAMLQELMARFKQRKQELAARVKGFAIKLRSVGVLVSPPNYIWPGLDPRYTAAYFFLKKHGFKHSGEKQNLVYRVPDSIKEPPGTLGGYYITRAKQEDMGATINFIKQHHAGFWPVETGLAFKNDPATVFIAKDQAGIVVGFAAHSITFPGSFGPTGVLESLRGKGLGGALLKWCAYDMKQANIVEMIIRWVEGDTMKFYSKSIGARVHQIYWNLKRKS
jgi:GNAT superfamily N-acetyltransferase